MSFDVVSVPDSGSLRNGKLSIAVSNIHVRSVDTFGSAVGNPNVSLSRYERITGLLNQALDREHRVDIVILPEVSVPHSYLTMVQRFCRRHQIAVIFGMEHRLVSGDRPQPSNIGTAYNHVVTILPYRRNGMLNEFRTFTRLKRHYGPGETQELVNRRLALPTLPRQNYHLFYWRQCYVTVFNCYELANVEDRSQFRSRIDFIVAVEWNPDTNYFSNIAESTARDLHCYLAQVNMAQYGDSRIVSPSKTERMNLLRTKGGKNETLLIQDIDIASLRAFQNLAPSGQAADGRFKVTPPDFSHSENERRIANLPPNAAD